jgi:hypothetical protein
VRLHDFFAILGLDMRVPDAIRINNNHRTVSALVETARLIYTDLLIELTRRDLFTQSIHDLVSALLSASFCVETDEYVLFKYFHFRYFRSGYLFNFIYNPGSFAREKSNQLNN